MTSKSDRYRSVLVSDRDPRHDPALQTSIRAAEIAESRLVDPRDLDDVDRIAAAGEVERVVFVRADDLLAGCWDAQIRVDEWPAEIRIDVLDLPSIDARTFADVVGRSWRRWNQARRRRNAIAGVILSAIAVLAAFALSR